MGLASALATADGLASDSSQAQLLVPGPPSLPRRDSGSSASRAGRWTAIPAGSRKEQDPLTLASSSGQSGAVAASPGLVTAVLQERPRGELDAQDLDSNGSRHEADGDNPSEVDDIMSEDSGLSDPWDENEEAGIEDDDDFDDEDDEEAVSLARVDDEVPPAPEALQAPSGPGEAGQPGHHGESVPPGHLGPEAPVAESRPPSQAGLRLTTGYPDQNLPAKTGIGIPMMSTPPSFIRSVPARPELLYTAPDHLFDDIVKAEADRISKPESVLNKVVYDSVGQRPVGDALAGGTEELSPEVAAKLHRDPKELLPFYIPSSTEDTTLVFESRFESGNLRRAIQAYPFEYDLILNPDYNTKSHTQWYHFSVANTRRGPCYRFNILNMVKPTSVYNDGMKPLLYSSIAAASTGVGWVRCGYNIAYYQNGIRRKDKGGTMYYTLTFTVNFEHDADLVYFSHCYPYTYTDLQLDLRTYEQDPQMMRRFRRRKLCETLAGNACDLITITSFCSDAAAIRSRRAVVLTARVHPGESNASWVMKGILDYLTGPSLDARILRDNFVFKIIPMLNPDGVIVGNYRCSLAGQDLNRLWDDPSRKMHPTVFFTKSMFRHLLDDREVVLFVDIHGHSRKKNVFMYGNCENNSLREKIFPGLLCRSSECFSFDDCCFKIQRSKESTARVVAYRELSVVNSFTLEASFCGADFGPLGDQHFTIRHLEEMGYMVCDAILDFCDPDQTKVMQVCKELQVLFPDDGNSDDVSDSEVDENEKARRRMRRARKAARTPKERASKPNPASRPDVQDGQPREAGKASRLKGTAKSKSKDPSRKEDGDVDASASRKPAVPGEVKRSRKKKTKDKTKDRGDRTDRGERTQRGDRGAAAGSAGTAGPGSAAASR